LRQEKRWHIGSTVASLLLLCRAAVCHPLDIAYLQLTGDNGHATATLDVHPNVAAGLMGIAPEQATAEHIPAHAALFLERSLADSRLLDAGAACRWSAPRALAFAQSARLVAEVDCPNGLTDLTWKMMFLHRLPPTYQVLGKVEIGGHESVFTAQVSRDQVAFRAAPAAGFGRFVHMGIEHIGATPSQWRTPDGAWKLPDGIDHILFLLGLILAGGTLSEMFVTVTGFTLGHSLTLALALLGWIRISPRIIEPAIALTISYVAAEGVFLGRQHKARWKIAAAFGLIHGLGFASALGALRLDNAWNLLQALFGYNIGIEIGQSCIIAVLAPLVLALRRSRFFLVFGLRACSLGISGTGLYWFVVRAFG
jgi:hypothetical protein